MCGMSANSEDRFSRVAAHTWSIIFQYCVILRELYSKVSFLWAKKASTESFNSTCRNAADR